MGVELIVDNCDVSEIRCSADIKRPTDRRTMTAFISERVRKTREQEANQDVTGADIDKVEKVRPISMTTTTSNGPSPTKGLPLSLYEKEQLIEESAGHPYLKQILHGLKVYSDGGCVRQTNSSQLRAQKHSKIPLITTSSPDKCLSVSPAAVEALDLMKLHMPEESDQPLSPPWLVSKHSIVTGGPGARKPATNSKTATPRKADVSPPILVRGPSPPLYLREVRDGDGVSRLEDDRGYDVLERLKGLVSPRTAQKVVNDVVINTQRSRKSGSPDQHNRNVRSVSRMSHGKVSSSSPSSLKRKTIAETKSKPKKKTASRPRAQPPRVVAAKSKTSTRFREHASAPPRMVFG
eukprot:TRINITY_DN6739_c2_g1_i1.p1 TRINITY_DN6739_c2_g1~~TRINITY_DN6739_c2_g1_i1.p1  ORF type:complete len:350 (+),score=62.92 TRINITY_DN6739_c2_g1_i1:42-1091(+)